MVRSFCLNIMYENKNMSLDEIKNAYPKQISFEEEDPKENEDEEYIAELQGEAGYFYVFGYGNDPLKVFDRLILYCIKYCIRLKQTQIEHERRMLLIKEEK